MDVSEAIRLKRAVRNYKPDPLPKDVVMAILNAGRRAQSSKNSQPWHFIAIQEPSILEALSTCGEWAGHLAKAPLGVALLHPHYLERFQILFDIGQSAAYMQLAAWELGVASCPATIYQSEKGREILQFPDNLEIRFALSFGYPQDTGLLTKNPKKTGRRKIEDVAHWDQW